MDDIVAAEHDLSHLSIYKLGSQNLVQYFGRGMEAYFRFVFFNGLFNAIVFVVLSSFVLSEDSEGTEFLFFRLITNRNVLSWVYLATTLFTISFLIMLWLRNNHYHYRADEENEDIHLGQYNIDNVDCVNMTNDPISNCLNIRQRIPKCLFFIRVCIFIMFIGLFFAYYFCQLKLLSWVDRFSNIVAGQTIMSLFFVFVDLIWRLSCTFLTSLESHKYLSSYRKSDCIKSFFSRITMFSIFIWVQNSESTLQNRAQQMFNLLLLNTALSPFIDIFTNLLYNRCCFFICCGSTSRISDTEYKLTFNVADKYTQLLFRQYLINQCLLFVPIAPLIGLIGSILEWWTDKYKLLHLAKRPERHSSRFTLIISIFMFFNLIAILFAYPNGYFWIGTDASLPPNPL
jgi:hypothetical protein